MQKASLILSLILAGMLASACVPLAAGTAGALITDEGLNESDGFDPLENTKVGREIYD